MKLIIPQLVQPFVKTNKNDANDALVVRARICSELEFLGIEIDEQSNAQNANVISTETGRVAVRIMHADEELMIAKSNCGILGLTN